MALHNWVWRSFAITKRFTKTWELHYKFSDTRRMKRNSKSMWNFTRRNQIKRKSSYRLWGIFCWWILLVILDKMKILRFLEYNDPPPSQPGLWCQWIVEDDQLIWNGMKKVYDYTEWLKYLIEHFFKPLGYTLNGSVEYQGEESSDFGKIIVENNVVKLKGGKKIYED